jgi:ribosome-associated GTPase EngA
MKKSLFMLYFILISWTLNTFADTGAHPEHSLIGQSGDAAQVSQTIEIKMIENRFIPDEITIKQGETIRFLVKNDGKKHHEFAIDAIENLKEHAKMMRAHPNMAHNDPNRIKVAILGRPNVGKSQLFNALSKKQQAIVADRAGTTRDINRNMVKFNKQEIELLDTAGIRRSGKIEVGIEKFSVIRSLSAIEEADICLLLMDVNELGTQLDQKIAGLVKEAGKGLILVVSKWDIVKDKDAYTRDLLAPQIQQEFIFVPWAPLIFTSSITGQNVTKIFELVSEIHHNRQQKISTSVLNRWLRAVVDEHPPAGLKNTHPRLNYITQTDEETPNFKVFGSQTKFLHWSYKRYLERRLREQFGFEGTPIKMWFIPKNVDRHTEKDKEV